jgi:hypothetical protein
MSAVPPLDIAHQPANERKKGRAFNYYPLLGVLLAIIAAAMMYGGLFLLLADDQNLFQTWWSA